MGGGKLRYLNGEVVDTTGKRYIEIEKKYPNMPKPVYLKAARKYRFHWCLDVFATVVGAIVRYFQFTNVI